MSLNEKTTDLNVGSIVILCISKGKHDLRRPTAIFGSRIILHYSGRIILHYPAAFTPCILTCSLRLELSGCWFAGALSLRRRAPAPTQ